MPSQTLDRQTLDTRNPRQANKIWEREKRQTYIMWFRIVYLRCQRERERGTLENPPCMIDWVIKVKILILVKFGMCTLVSRVHMMFYILTKWFAVPGIQSTHDKHNKIKSVLTFRILHFISMEYFYNKLSMFVLLILKNTNISVFGQWLWKMLLHSC